MLAIAGNVEAPLSDVDPSQWGTQVAYELKENKGISIAEAGNEMYLKGGVANPVQYGHMYMAAIDDDEGRGNPHAAAVQHDRRYPAGYMGRPGSWSEDANGGGWLREAVTAVPGLASAILANGISVHPYGALGENRHDELGHRFGGSRRRPWRTRCWARSRPST